MNKYLKIALALSIITIIYNLIEGGVSVYYGLEDETLSLLGFGVDSFVEVISGIAILHLVLRLRKGQAEERDRFESDALRVTGRAFYLLGVGLVLGSIDRLIHNTQPETTVVGIIVSVISIATMYFLLSAKLKTGKALGSQAIIADANCTKTCFYLSVILLFSSGIYELTGFAYIDVVGSLGIAWFSFKEGKEAFVKASMDGFACACGDSKHL